ncbi:unnamed protein product [Mytilus coruscus]|uniref:Uncharacterized protein n=1 Tax=Mytilus coruscus TaxID=42192 RepID=A0A6J8A3Y6_MYTCO|nr:unnamed protein product [Mytilus coruscus]
MTKYRNLQIPSYDIFKNQLPKLQNYVTNSKYFVHNGKAGEKMRFTDNFSLFNWLKLPENEKQSHKLQDCSTCLTTHGSISSLHKSYSHASSLVQPCKDLVNNINEIIVSPSSSIGKKTVQNVIKVLEPIIETQYNINFKKTLAEVMNMSPRESVVEKNNKIMTSIRETTQQIAESMTENDGDVQNLLASGKSFLQYERERLQTCYVTTDQAERQADDLQTKLASGSKDTEQVSYTPTRTEDLQELRKGIVFDGIPYTFQLRFFSGDGPARQFEAVMKHVSSPTNNISEDETNDNLEETAQKETNQVSSELALLNPINFIPDDNSESTEDYIPNIPIVQGPPEVPAIDQGRKHLEDKENKEKYKSYIKVSRWTVQPTCSKIDVHESLFNKPNKLPANRAKTPLRCKRKLFASEVSKQEIASCRKKTTLDMVVQLLGPSSDVDDCLKYRELKLKHPGHKSFISAFDQSFSKLQIEVSKRYFALKEETTKDDGKENRENLLADKEIAQKLLDHWECTTFNVQCTK